MFEVACFHFTNPVFTRFTLTDSKRIYVFFSNLFFYLRSYRVYSSENPVENSVETVRNDWILPLKDDYFYDLKICLLSKYLDILFIKEYNIAQMKF